VPTDEVNIWNELANQLASDSHLVDDPPFHSRLLAITHAAIHNALNTIERRYKLYALDAAVSQGGSPEAAVATAAYDVLVDQFNLLIGFGFPPEQAVLDSAYATSLAQIADGAAKTRGIAIGRIAASAILGLRAGDGWNTQPVQDFNYPRGTSPREYRFTPPSNFAFLPRWGTVAPFVFRDAF
jgi:hypothetical protein